MIRPALLPEVMILRTIGSTQLRGILLGQNYRHHVG